MSTSRAFFASIAVATAVFSMPASAQVEHGKVGDMKMAQVATDGMTDGEVRKVDVDVAKITLRHADIKSLDMPAMTMVFNVRDKAMLDKVKPGNKVKFKVISDAGKFTVTELQVVQ